MPLRPPLCHRRLCETSDGHLASVNSRLHPYHHCSQMAAVGVSETSDASAVSAWYESTMHCYDG
jgi:hypothetical protein